MTIKKFDGTDWLTSIVGKKWVLSAYQQSLKYVYVQQNKEIYTGLE